MSAGSPCRSPSLVWRPVAVAFALVALAQLGVIAWAIWGDPVQVPWQDELFHYAFFARARAGAATWADYWQPLGDVHRTVFPRLLDVAAIVATGWDRRAWLAINPLLVAGAVATLAATARRTVGAHLPRWPFVAACAALLFALSQYSQWLQPFGLQFALVVCCGAVALWALAARPGDWPPFALAVGATWVASWSGLHGLALWPALLPLAVLAGWRQALAWVACAAAVIATYADGLPRAAAQPLAPGELVAFTLANLGAPLGTLQAPADRAHFWDHSAVRLDQRPALAIGALGVALLVANLAALWRRGGIGRDTLARILPWCCLAAFAVACAALTALGRATPGTSAALTARYQTFALLWWVALLALGAQVVAAGAAGRWRALVAANYVALGLGATLFLAVNLTSGLLLRDLHGALRRAESCARDLAASPDPCLTLLHPVPSVARLRLAALADARLALYRAGPPPAATGTAAPPAAAPDLAGLRRLPIGALYAVDGLPGPLAPFDGTPPPPHFPANQRLQLTGWAADAARVPPAPASGLFLAIDDRPPVWVPLTLDRPEVAARFGPALGPSGFRLDLSAGALPPGRHTLRVTVVSADGLAAYEASPALVFFVDAAGP